jgi:translocation and assembly module TamB
MDARDAAPSPPAATAATAPAPPRRHAWRWWAGGFAALVLVLLLAVGGAAWWGLRTEPGTAWLLSRLPGVEVQNPRGRLIGDFGADAVVWRFGDGGELRLADVAWQGLGVYRSEVPGAWALVWFDRLAAGEARLTLPDRPQTNTRPPPQHLKLPLELVVRQFALDELQAAALGDAPLQGLRARIHLGGRATAADSATTTRTTTSTTTGSTPPATTGLPADAVRHRIDDLAVDRGPLQARGRLVVGAEAPMPADIAITLAQPVADGAAAPAALPAWDARLSLAGPLARSQLRGQLRVQAQPVQTLDIDAVLQPFAAWPLAQLNARAQALDIGALLAGGPRTALSGNVVIAMADAEKPLQATASLANARPGAWNAGLLPARQLKLTVQADPRDRRQARLEQFEAELGDAAQTAGHVRGDGLWRADGGWQLGLVLQALRPDRLDARVMPMTLDGRVTLEGNATPPGAAAPARQRVSMTSDVSGQLLDRRAGAPVRLQAAGTLDSSDGGALALELQRLVASQGDARAEAQGRLQRASASADWQARGTLTLAGFDPRPWVPGDAASPLRRAAGRLNGQADVDLSWSSATAAPAGGPAPASAAGAGSAPAAAAATAPRPLAAAPIAAALPAGLQGRADLVLAPSVLAGVPLQGEAHLRAARGADPLQLTLQAELAGNRVNAEGRVTADPARDHWSGRIDAPALNRLAPLLQVVMPGRTAAATGAGTLRASAEAGGRWPRLRTRGELHADAVVCPGGRLRRADARWDLGTAPGAAMTLDATVADLHLAASERARQVPALSVKVSGTAERHELSLQSDIAAAPPAWADTLQAPAAPAAPAATAATAAPAARSTTAPPTAATAAAAEAAPATRPAARPRPTAAGPRTRVTLAASGALRHGAEGGPWSIAGWGGRIDSLVMQRAESTQPLLRTAGVQLDWQADTATRPMRLVVQPGRAELLGSNLRWSRLAWTAGRDTGGRNQPALLDADVTLDPLRIAPLLARLQPSLGWNGDLAISGRAVVRTAPALHADLTLQRHAGDLSMMQGDLRRALGLKELKASLQARGTRWRTDLRVAGSNVGAAQATVTAVTSAQSPWPGTETPIDGSVQLRIDDIGVHDARLPVGWHLAGRVSAEAKVGGRIGAPTWRGTVRGSDLGVNNFVEGVRVHGGELQATLDGESGRIDRFSARAGDGQLRAQGEARFGAEPRARITVTAERFRALGRVDRLVDLSGQGSIDLQRQRVAVQGRFQVDQGLVDLGRGEAPELSKDVRVVDGPTPGRPEKPAKAAPARPVQLDLRVDLGSNLRVRGKGVNTLLAGDLRLTAPGGLLDVEGTVRTVGGTYEAYGEKLRIDRGLVTFVGPVANPRLDIQAVRADLRDVEVGVAITGTALNPRVKLFSSPEMSELDKLSWLTLGRSSAGLASDQSAILQRAALALLAGQRGSAGGEGVAKRLGLDKISVGRGQSGGLSDAVVSLGKQISERFYVGYAQSLDATGGSWELVYKVARRMTVRVQAGEETAVDLVWTWLWG